METSVFIELIADFEIILTTCIEYRETIFCYVEDMPRMHPQLNDVPNHISTARFSTISNQVGTNRPPIMMNRGTMPSLLAISRLMVCNCGALIELTDCFQVGNSMYLLTEFEPVPVSSKMATLNKAFNITPIETRTQFAGLRKNYEFLTSCWALSICTLQTYGAAAESNQNCGFAIAPDLFCKLIFAFMNVKLPSGQGV